MSKKKMIGQFRKSYIQKLVDEGTMYSVLLYLDCCEEHYPTLESLASTLELGKEHSTAELRSAAIAAYHAGLTKWVHPDGLPSGLDLTERGRLVLSACDELAFERRAAK